MELLVREQDHVQARITIKSKLTIVGDIRCALCKDDLITFENSCFGLFLNVEARSFTAPQILHLLNCRRVKTPKKLDEFWFDIFGKPARFSMVEFALVTGLNCGELPSYGDDLLHDNTLKDTYFADVGKITVASLKDQMERMNDGIDRVKIALVLLLNHVILAKDEKNQIKMETLSLANHLDHFNAFPWGRLSYRMTFKSFDKDMKREGPQYKYTLFGFPWAIQFWAYESFPHLAEMYAHRRWTEKRYPRMLNWKPGVKKTQWKDVARALMRETHIRPTLKATEEELSKEYMRDVDYADKASNLAIITGKKRKHVEYARCRLCKYGYVLAL